MRPTLYARMALLPMSPFRQLERWLLSGLNALASTGGNVELAICEIERTLCQLTEAPALSESGDIASCKERKREILAKGEAAGKCRAC